MDKKLLLKPRLAEGTVELPGVGTLRVRALSRAEVMDDIQKMRQEGLGAYERRVLELGLVDPELTADEIAEWYRVSGAAEIEPVVEKIIELSGLGENVDKEAMLSFREQSGPDI